MNNRKIGIAIPTYNRFEMTLESFEQVLNDERVSSITLVDDCSTNGDGIRLLEWCSGRKEPVIVYKNGSNLDCYKNKAVAVSKCTDEWCILFDSDNILTPDYLNKIYSIPEWDEHTIYAPVFAEPHFDYRRFEGLTITRENVKNYINEPMFLTALNTANYFVHRDTYLKAFNLDVEPVTADSIYMTYRFLEQGNSIYFVPGLTYHHRVHKGSHYQNNNHRTGKFHEQTVQKLREL